ncbi:MAG: xanthine dehydrogenase family protein molybdopterin-binding subunit [Pseudomonadota bacterium]
MGNETLTRRIEGRAKVCGNARYVDDIRAEQFGSDFDHGIIVTSTKARGVIRRIDSSTAFKVPGVLAVFTHENAPRLNKIISLSMAELADIRPLQGPEVRHYGQPIAVVVAESPTAAREGANLVAVEYEDDEGDTAFSLAAAEKRLKPVKRAGMAPGKISSGNPEQDFEASPVKHDAVYRNAPHHHNTMEPGSAIARWDDDGGVTVQAAVQWQHVDTLVIGQAFGLGLADRLPGFIARKMLGSEISGKVRLKNTLAGGAFGRNLTMVHVLLACMAAKAHGRAVKISVSREQCFTLFSFRAEVRQRLRIGAESNGKLKSLIVEPDVAAGIGGSFVEPVGAWSCHIYNHESRHLQHRVARLDTQAPGWMRAPGGSSAMFALETAMDDIARDRGIDPLDFRLMNFAESDPESGKEWHSNRLKSCFDQGAEAIGWRDRYEGGTLRNDGRVIGYGMATCWETHFQFPASVRVRLTEAGEGIVFATLAEMGQGGWAALTTLASRSLGLPREAIRLETDASNLPAGAGAIASTGTYSNGVAIHEASMKLHRILRRLAVRDRKSPFYGKDEDAIKFEDGNLVGDGNLWEPITDLLSRHPKREVEATATTGRTFGRSRKAKATFGACFVEVSIDAITHEVRVEHMVGAFAGGRIIEPVIAKNQISGGMIWGLGQALMEESTIDERTGRWTNGNLAEALIPTQADVGKVSVILVEDDDPDHPVGMKGLSEIGVMGPGPAIANAIFDALGTRVRHLPIRIDDLMGEAA